MRIGFDVSQTGKDKAGCGYFAYSLARSFEKKDIQNQYFLYTNFGEDYSDSGQEKELNVNSKNFSYKLNNLSLRQSQKFWRNPPVDVEHLLGDVDILHSNNYYTPLNMKGRFIYTLYDLSFFENPEWHTAQNWAVTSKGVFRAAVYADALISISHYSKMHFLEYFPFFPEERIWVVHLASRFPLLSPAQSPNRIGVSPERYWLSTATLEPRKNHVRLLKAYADVLRTNPDIYPLVLVGGSGWKSKYLQEIIDELGLQEKVFILGYVDDSTLQWLYQNCYAFLYPSLFEGFGMPPLEAMSMGAAVITSNTTSLPEVVGDAAFMIDPYKTEEIADAILALYKNPALRQDLQARSLKRAALFSWEKSAEQVLDIYEQVYRLPKRQSVK